jgi:hypothetical protein
LHSAKLSFGCNSNPKLKGWVEDSTKDLATGKGVDADHADTQGGEAGRGLKKGEKQKQKKSNFRCCLTLSAERERQGEGKKTPVWQKNLQLN